MVWKQDLAQLKQKLNEDPQPVVPPPKPSPPPPVPGQSLQDADLLFLRAMGGVAVPALPSTQGIPTASVALGHQPRRVEPDVDFGLALGDLKGMRPISKNPVFDATPGNSHPPISMIVPPTVAVQPTQVQVAIRPVLSPTVDTGEDRISVVTDPLEPEMDFQQALGNLKGMRSFSSNPVYEAPSSQSRPEIPSPVSPAIVSLTVVPSAMAPLAAVAPTIVPVLLTQLEPAPALRQDPVTSAGRSGPGPMLIHLAAGMAIEVDVTLDLRRHTLSDARERLKERIDDGLTLKWRTLLVVLGPSEANKQGFLAFLTTPQARSISRYAQAPIPMGGPQAWVLYFAQTAWEGTEGL